MKCHAAMGGHRSPDRRLGMPLCLVLLSFPLIAGGCATTQPAGPSRRTADTAELRRIRVLIFEGPAAAVAVQGPSRVVDPAGMPLFANAAGVSIQAAVDLQQPSAVRLNGRGVPSGTRIVPLAGGAVDVNGRAYAGSLTLLNRSGRLLLVSNLDIEEYLPGVLTGELFPGFHPEAFKAQAVAARTYALYQKFANPKPDYDMTSTTASQVYVGAGSDKAVQAVRATDGRVLTWASPAGERMFSPYYSSTCGGETSPVNYLNASKVIPPLAGLVPCTSCTHARYYTWPAVHMSRDEVTRKLRARYPVFGTLGTIQRIEPIETSPSGRIVWLQLLDAAGQCVRMRASQFRLVVGPGELRSTWCHIEPTADGFAFTNGRGFGHGVGLCQFGADGLAQAGWNYRAILEHYYPNSHIVKAY